MKNFLLIRNYYSRKDVQDALLKVAKDREIVGVFSNGNFGKRPNVLVYPNDILESVKEGIISFHGSVERWSNPMALQAGMIKQELDRLRTGWDLIIDPDCPDFEIAKLTTKMIIKALEDHGIKNYSLKYTGGNSFHVGIPFELFPEKVNFIETQRLYPELPQKIIEYLKDYIKERLREEILSLDDPISLARRVRKNITEIIDKDGLDPFKIIQIDSMLVTSRHMFRLPYSLHERSLLVSLPIKPSQLDRLKKEDANPSKVKVEVKFLSRDVPLREATALVVEAMDWSQKHKIRIEKIPYKGPRRAIRYIPEKYFPPCISKILMGLPDGRKRSVFILTNFLRNMGWDWEKVEKKIMEWNEKNTPPLRQNYIRTQLRWHQREKRNLLPPNCDNDVFYKDMGVCFPDDICKGMKNPINYPFKKMKRKEKS